MLQMLFYCGQLAEQNLDLSSGVNMHRFVCTGDLCEVTGHGKVKAEQLGRTARIVNMSGEIVADSM